MVRWTDRQFGPGTPHGVREQALGLVIPGTSSACFSHSREGVIVERLGELEPGTTNHPCPEILTQCRTQPCWIPRSQGTPLI